MITPRAPMTPFVSRILQGIPDSIDLDRTYRIFDKIFKPVKHRFKHKLLGFILKMKYRKYRKR